MYIQTINNSYKPKTNAFSAFKNEPRIRNGNSTRTYRYHNTNKSENKVKIASWLGGILGATIPVLTFTKKQNKNIFKLHYGMKEMLLTSSSAIAAGTISGILADKKQNSRPKIKEGIFQMLNATVPLLTIPPIIDFMKNSPKLNNTPCKLLGTVSGLFAGMVVAADLSNRINDPKDIEPDRKLNYKDSLANLDDAIGALVLVKVPFINKLPIEPALPAIYAWCGYRAGQSN